jgi:hypothetical protein
MCRDVYAVRDYAGEGRYIGLYREAFPEHRCIGEAVISRSRAHYRLDNLQIFETADRRKGFGTCLLRQVLNDLAAWDAEDVHVVVEPGQKNTWLMAWYIKLGFRRLDDDSGGYAHLLGRLPRIRDGMGMKCCLVSRAAVGRPRKSL